MAQAKLESIKQHPTHGRGWALITLTGVEEQPSLLEFTVVNSAGSQWSSLDGKWVSSQVSLTPREWALENQCLELTVGPEVVNRLLPCPITFVMSAPSIREKCLWPRLDPSGPNSPEPSAPNDAPPRVPSTFASSDETTAEGSAETKSENPPNDDTLSAGRNEEQTGNEGGPIHSTDGLEGGGMEGNPSPGVGRRPRLLAMLFIAVVAFIMVAGLVFKLLDHPSPGQELKEIDKLKEKLYVLNHQLEDALTRNDSLEKDAKDLNFNINEKDEAIKILKTENSVIKRKIKEEKVDETGKFKNEIMQLKTRIREKDAAAQDFERRIATLTEENERLQSLVGQSSSNLEDQVSGVFEKNKTYLLKNISKTQYQMLHDKITETKDVRKSIKEIVPEKKIPLEGFLCGNLTDLCP